MALGVIFVENYLAGGSDQIAKLLLHKLPFEKLVVMVNRSNDTSILLADRLPPHAAIKIYNIPTFPELLTYVRNIRYSWFRGLLWLICHLLRYPYFLFSILYFFSLILKINASFLVVNNGGYPGGDFCRSASIAGSLVPGLKVFHIVHSVAASPSLFSIPIEWAIDRMIDSRCRLITICQACADQLKSRRFIRQDIKVIYNGIEDTGWSRSIKLKKKFKILNVGYFDNNKNQAMLIMAVAELVKKGYENIHVYFLGNETKDFQAKKCKLLAEKLKVSNYFNFEGFVADTVEWYRDSDLFVLCSNNEGLPLSIIEAMSAGLPVIATAVGGVCELVDDGVNGYVVRSGDVQGMANRIELIMLDGKMRAKFGIASKALFDEQFTLDRMVTQYVQTLDRNINSH
jgi:glycosyltransferase involved in cell wall biosynthesis